MDCPNGENTFGHLRKLLRSLDSPRGRQDATRMPRETPRTGRQRGGTDRPAVYCALKIKALSVPVPSRSNSPNFGHFRPKTAQVSPKSASEAPKTAQDSPKSAQDTSKTASERSKRAPRRPKSAPRGPTMASRRPERLPRGPPRGTKRLILPGKCTFGSLVWAPSWSRPGGLLGRIGGPLGRLGALLGRLGALLGASWAVLG